MFLLIPKELSFLSRWILWFARFTMLSVFSLNVSCESNTVPKYLCVCIICTSSSWIVLGLGSTLDFLKSMIISLVFDTFRSRKLLSHQLTNSGRAEP